MRRWAWYYPAMQDAGWTCWGAVVEVALRNMARLAKVELKAADCRRPTVLVRSLEDRTRPPHALTIQLAGFERSGAVAQVHGHPARRVFWELTPADAPWRRAEPRNRSSQRVRLMSLGTSRLAFPVPDARTIWEWACRTGLPGDKTSARQARELLGITTPRS
jgi:hypothetical protein